MPSMDVGADYKLKRFRLCVGFEASIIEPVLTLSLQHCTVTIASIEDFVLEDRNRFPQTIGFDIFDKQVELLPLHRRKDIGQRVSGEFLIGVEFPGHDTRPSTMLRSTASHSLRSHRLEPPMRTGLGKRPTRIPR